MSVNGTVTVVAKDLKIDHRVQRGIEESQVRYLVNNWNDEFVGPIVVSRRVDGYYVVDGLQRVTAVMRLGKGTHKFVASVHNGLSLQDEARLFLAVNQGRKTVSTYAKYRVSVVAGDPVAMAVENTVEGMGLHVAASSSDLGLGIAGTLLRIVGRVGDDIAHGSDLLERSLRVLWNVYGMVDDPWKAETVEGLAIFFKRHPQADEATLQKKLARVTATQLLAKARARSTVSNRVATQVADVLAEIYDKGKQQGRLRVAS